MRWRVPRWACQPLNRANGLPFPKALHNVLRRRFFFVHPPPLRISPSDPYVIFWRPYLVRNWLLLKSDQMQQFFSNFKFQISNFTGEIFRNRRKKTTEVAFSLISSFPFDTCIESAVRRSTFVVISPRFSTISEKNRPFEIWNLKFEIWKLLHFDPILVVIIRARKKMYKASKFPRTPNCHPSPVTSAT